VQTTLLEAHLSYTDLQSGKIVQTTPVPIEASRVEEPQPEAEPDAEVSAQRERVDVTRALQQAAAQSDLGQFDEAQRVIDETDQRINSSTNRRKKTAMNAALSEELSDARNRMQSRAMWEGGGRAEVRDATQMHKMQRCTNTMASSSGREKSSKTMYSSSRQDEYISRSKRSC